ncbi:MAG TPA: tryptophan--tRNA ligase [Planctomycetes bacterium]|nr:tryptophan--tRNA ligase [Planctomycetota bacterium]
MSGSERRLVALTGIKPTGAPHIGNLLGAILPALALTRTYQGIYFIADYHALTTEHDGDALRESTRQVAATWLAMGLDTEKNIFFRQSDIPEVCELSWVLSCFVGVGQLQRAHAYKDAVAKGKEATQGLFSYPVLMAADILLYESNVVPVGKDQKQHVEMCRQMAHRVNETYGEGTLVVPEPLIREEVATVPGLDGQKMSKSYGNTVEIFLPPKKLRKKLMKIVTGSEALEDPKDPDRCNVVKLFRLFAEEADVAEMERRYRAGGFGYGEAKQKLFEVYDAFIAPHRERYEELLAHPEVIEEELAKGKEKARVVAGRVMERLRKRAGLR